MLCSEGRERWLHTGTQNHSRPQALCSLLFLHKELAGRVFCPSCEVTHRPTSFLIGVLHFALEVCTVFMVDTGHHVSQEVQGENVGPVRVPREGRGVSVSSEEAKGKKRLSAEPRLPGQTAWAAEPFSLPAPRALPSGPCPRRQSRATKPVRSGDVARVWEPPGRDRGAHAPQDAGGVLSSAGLSAHELGP